MTKIPNVARWSWLSTTPTEKKTCAFSVLNLVQPQLYKSMRIRVICNALSIMTCIEMQSFVRHTNQFTHCASVHLSSFHTIFELLCTCMMFDVCIVYIYEYRLCVVLNGLHKAHTDKQKGVKYLKCHVGFCFLSQANTATTITSTKCREQFCSHSNSCSQSGCAFKCRWRVFFFVFLFVAPAHSLVSILFSFFLLFLFVLVDHNDHTPINWAQTLN